MICESCRRAPATEVVGDPAEDSSGVPFRVCAPCARRLRHLALRPREWFHLAATHGWESFLLHDDFYEDDGTATQPEQPVEDAEAHPFPSRDEQMRSHAVALEVALVRWQLDEEIVALLAAAPEETLRGLRAIVERPSAQLESRAYEIAARALGRYAEAWIRERWAKVDARTFFALAEASAKCMPASEGLARVADAIAALPAQARRDALSALSWFRDPAALRVLEAHVMEPITERYGRVAACCALTWAVVERWLEGGRPMSLVALDALKSFVRYDTPLLRELAPALVDPPSRARLEHALARYAERDPAPRVQKDVAYLLRNAGALLQPEAEREP